MCLSMKPLWQVCLKSANRRTPRGEKRERERERERRVVDVRWFAVTHLNSARVMVYGLPSRLASSANLCCNFFFLEERDSTINSEAKRERAEGRRRHASVKAGVLVLAWESDRQGIRLCLHQARKELRDAARTAGWWHAALERGQKKRCGCVCVCVCVCGSFFNQREVSCVASQHPHAPAQGSALGDTSCPGR